MSRAAILGHVQGYAHRLEEALRSLGADPDAGTLPAGLTVVQVGDLVHKGPDSAGCLAICDRFLHASPARWTQLLGNHEAQYLGGPTFWPALPFPLQSDIRRWADSGEVILAVALDTMEFGDVLISHSGLTKSKWLAIGQPATASEAADALNDELETNPEQAFTPGSMLGHDNQLAGVVWAEAARELLASWAGMRFLPFSQVHGHDSAYRWRESHWVPQMPDVLRVEAIADPASHHTVVTWSDGHAIIGVDPGYGTKGALWPLVPLTLTDRLDPG